MGEQLPVEEEAHGVLGDLAAALGHVIITEGAAAGGSEASPASGDTSAQVAFSKEGGVEALPTREEASKAVGSSAEVAQAAPEARGAARAASAPGEAISCMPASLNRSRTFINVPDLFSMNTDNCCIVISM